MPNPAWDYLSGPFTGPYDMVAPLLANVTPAQLPAEGIWTFASAAKFGSIEVAGSFTTVGINLYGSNGAASPLNQYTVTIGGTPAQGDILALTFGSPVGNRVVSYTVPSSPSLNSEAAAIAALISADAVLVPLGFLAAAVGAVITISFPSSHPADSVNTPSAPPRGNGTTLTGAVTGTETLTVAAGTTGTLMTAVASAGFTALPAVPRWLTARATVLTGGGASANVNWHGVA